jgi:hypothetical protein
MVMGISAMPAMERASVIRQNPPAGCADRSLCPGIHHSLRHGDDGNLTLRLEDLYPRLSGSARHEMKDAGGRAHRICDIPVEPGREQTQTDGLIPGDENARWLRMARQYFLLCLHPEGVPGNMKIFFGEFRHLMRNDGCDILPFHTEGKSQSTDHRGIAHDG